MINIRTVLIDRTLCVDVIWGCWDFSSLTNWRSHHHHIVRMVSIALLIHVHLIVNLLVHGRRDSMGLGRASSKASLFCFLDKPVLVIASEKQFRIDLDITTLRCISLNINQILIYCQAYKIRRLTFVLVVESAS